MTALNGNGISVNGIPPETPATLLAKIVTVDGAGSTLDADFLDGKTTGTSGNTVPLLDGANTWSALNDFTTANDFGNPARFTSTNDNANPGPYFWFYRNSATPAANDEGGVLDFLGKDSGANDTEYALISSKFLDVTNGSVDGELTFKVRVANAYVSQVLIHDGVQFGSPTGGYKGAGSLNAKDVYNDNVALTCFALSEEFRSKGKIDLVKWDAKIPDEEVPEKVDHVPVMEEVRVDKIVLESDLDGTLVAKRKRVTEKRQAIDYTPIFDENGNGIDALAAPRRERRVTPATVIKREHKIARVFQKMLDDGFDPRNPDHYIRKMTADNALPGMPTEAEWEHNAISTGDLFMRLWLASEMMALVLADHETRIATLENK